MFQFTRTISSWSKSGFVTHIIQVGHQLFNKRLKTKSIERLVTWYVEYGMSNANNNQTRVNKDTLTKLSQLLRTKHQQRITSLSSIIELLWYSERTHRTYSRFITSRRKEEANEKNISAP